jgi:hypothetical protein
LFWIVVVNAFRIATCAWMQDGQSSPIEWNFLLIDTICLGVILMLTWSGDQFFAAFNGIATDHDNEESIHRDLTSGTPGFSDGAEDRFEGISLLFLGLIGFIGVGIWQIYLSQSNPQSRLDKQEIAAKLNSLKIDDSFAGWKVVETREIYESITPVVRQSALWPTRQWEFSSDDPVQPLLRLRIDGLWLEPPQADWLWRWYGWKTERPTREEPGVVSWGMSRSIAQQQCRSAWRAIPRGSANSGRSCTGGIQDDIRGTAARATRFVSSTAR